MSVSDLTTIRQCLRVLPLHDFSSPCLDYRVQKLTTASLVKIFIAAQLCGWESLRRIEKELRADTALTEEIGCCISAGQLCRRIDALPSRLLEAIFYSLVAKMSAMTQKDSLQRRDRLFLIDSTNLRLPPTLGDWACVTKHSSGVKIHTRLVVVSGHANYPDLIVPSTGNVSDYEGSDRLVTETDATYIMDRGYVSYIRMDRWSVQNIRFLIRINHHHLVKQVLHEEATDPNDPKLLRDAIVYLGGNFRWMNHPVRLIEFLDDQGRVYRIATTRYDLTAREIANLYRQRWQIELFFRWMKQHLHLAKLYSYQPQAVWNHILLAMITYAVVYLIRSQVQTQRSVWEILVDIRVYWHRKWKLMLEELARPPSRESSGRKVTQVTKPLLQPASCNVALVKPTKRRRGN